jgi:hypothetical protein
VAHALDLDELAIKDLLAEDMRAKVESIGRRTAGNDQRGRC